MMNSELVVYEYLKKHLKVPVYMDVPKDRPKKFVTLERVGGGFRDLVLDEPALSLYVYADTHYNAAVLADVVDECMRLMPDKVINVANVRRSGYSYYPDLETKQPSYLLVYTVLIDVQERN